MRNGFLKAALFLVLLNLAHAQDAKQFLSDGSQALAGNDFQKALAAFDHAIQLDPKDAEAYQGRGTAKLNLGDTDGAIADFSKAFDLNPELTNALFLRGWAKFHIKHDVDGAIADFDRELHAHSEDGPALLERGNARLFKGDPQAAIPDFDEAGRGFVKPDQATAFRLWGMAEYELTWKPAAADLPRKAVDHLNKSVDLDPTNQDEAHFFIWLTQAKDSTQGSDASRNLSDYLHTRPGKDTDWENQIGNYLTDSMTEADFLKLVDQATGDDSSTRKSQGYLYVGMKHLYAGDTKAATTYLQKSAQAGTDDVESDVARFWLSLHGPPTP